MSGDLVTSAKVADVLAAQLVNVDFSGATQMPFPEETTIPATVDGVNVNNTTMSTIQAMNTMISTQANNISAIAAVFDQTDVRLGLEVPE